MGASSFKSRSSESGIISTSRLLIKHLLLFLRKTIDTPAMTEPTTGRTPEAPDTDLTGEEPRATATKGSSFLMTNGRDGGGISWKQVARNGG